MNSNLRLIKYRFAALISFFIFFFLPVSVPAVAPNNIFGIHLAQPHNDEIDKAAELVNGKSGKWGYITLVIQENDRDKDKWQNIFNRLREKQLIPIIRLATQPEGENWRRPEVKDADQWVKFLDSLNWVVKDRYIVLFNEPNHGNEWGGEVDEKSFYQVSLAFAKALKEKNKDFFVMLAGFDASAPSWRPGMEDEAVFLRRLAAEDQTLNTIFAYVDGWASHSYPNPGFSGSPYDYGRGTIRTYEWELAFLKSLGVDKELPVFITETGWKRGQRSEESVAENFREAFEDVWSQDSRVKAATPFILDYQAPPFLDFSWKKYQSSDYYYQYYVVQSLPKVKGEPDQVEKGEIDFSLPKELVAQSKYNLKLTLKNQGQAIWDKNDGYELRIDNDGLKGSVLIGDLKEIKPFEEKTVDFSIKTDGEKEKEAVRFVLAKGGGEVIQSKVWQYRVLPLPSLELKAGVWPFGKAIGDSFEVQIFDIDENVVFKKKGVKMEAGAGQINNIQNVAIGELYRVVVLRPGYLPRQEYHIFESGDNSVKFKPLLPFDSDRDGKLSLKDLLLFFTKPFHPL